MGGVELREGTLVVDRAQNQLDELALSFSSILNRSEIEHVYIAGYVSLGDREPEEPQETDVDSGDGNGVDASRDR